MGNGKLAFYDCLAGPFLRTAQEMEPIIGSGQTRTATIDATGLEKGQKGHASRWQSKLILSAKQRYVILRSTHAILRIMDRRRLWQAL
jgi:hypothetical protein